jgi:hypothetical protein
VYDDSKSQSTVDNSISEVKSQSVYDESRSQSAVDYSEAKSESIYNNSASEAKSQSVYDESKSQSTVDYSEAKSESIYNASTSEAKSQSVYDESKSQSTVDYSEAKSESIYNESTSVVKSQSVYDNSTSQSTADYSTSDARSASAYDVSRSTSASEYDVARSTSASEYDVSRSTSASAYDISRSTSASEYDASRSTSASEYDAARSTSASEYNASRSTSISEHDAARSISVSEVNVSRSTSTSEVNVSTTSVSTSVSVSSYQYSSSEYLAENNIVYVLGGGRLGTGSPTNYGTRAANQTITLVNPTHPNANYSFVRWELTDAPAGVTLVGSTLYIPANAKGTIRLTAVWNTYTVNREDHIWYVQGYPNGEFKPEQTLTRAEIITAMYRLTTDSTKTSPLARRFTDVPNGKWYTQEVNYMASIGVAVGYNDGTFRPDQKITRAELTVLIARWLSVDVGNAAASPFSDLARNHWAYAEIVAFVENGWVEGYQNGTFKADQSVTRAEFVTIMNRVLGRKLALQDARGYSSLYSDLRTASHWAFSDIIEASVTHDHTYRTTGYEIWTNARITRTV